MTIKKINNLAKTIDWHEEIKKTDDAFNALKLKKLLLEISDQTFLLFIRKLLLDFQKDKRISTLVIALLKIEPLIYDRLDKKDKALLLEEEK